jgi:lysyl-tRNA synthetase class 2
MAEIRIHEKIFEKFPAFRRGIVVAKNIRNQGHSEELEALLKEALARAAEAPVDLKKDPRMTAWQEAHRAFGSNPNKFPPAHAALLKRVQKPGAKIPFISRVVAVMNDNSIRGIIPVGGDDTARAGGDLVLCFAEGDENFTPLSDPEKTENPEPGEVIYMVSQSRDVMCRRWNWRNGYNTRITEETESMVMNIDGIGEDSETRAVAVRDRVAQMLETFCGAQVETTLLSPSQPSYPFEL